MLHARLGHSAPFRLVHDAFHLNSTALIGLIGNLEGFYIAKRYLYKFGDLL